MIALDLCQANYRMLLITNLKFSKKNIKYARKEEKSIPYAILLGLKIMELGCECKGCKQIWLKPISGLIIKFPNIYQLCNGDILKFFPFLRKRVGVNPYQYMDTGKDLTKNHDLIKKSLTTTYI